MTVTLPATLPPVSSLESYVQAVNAIPMLTQEREQALGRRLKEQNDLTAARDMVLSHLRLVVSVARNYMGYGLPQADLVQEGNIGLMKAVKRFDPERGVRLASFAIHWIKAEIHEYILRNWRMVKIATTKAQRKLFFNLRSMKPTMAALTPKEIRQVAQTLNVKESEVIEMEQRLQGGDIPLEPAPDDTREDLVTPIAYLAEPGEGPAELFEREEGEALKAEGLTRALSSLDERSRRIIRARWLAESDPKTLHELAEEFGVSAERIRQIEAKAMQKMKKELAALV
ncbi:MAG TPA: RNA polymerase sigma factor RpoH [Usitatibacter sp.]|jgi:RNA polymerase sigma-32 factor|nr:RNA polymerase sigma factor RpoH [Usitatibacter sp.]